MKYLLFDNHDLCSLDDMKRLFISENSSGSGYVINIERKDKGVPEVLCKYEDYNMAVREFNRVVKEIAENVVITAPRSEATLKKVYLTFD